MTRPMPTVSVLMPVYNAAPYIKEAVESILSQTFEDFELLIFNDGSTDESSSVIRKIEDERIIFFDSEDNLGYVAHLNKGLLLAKGKYIARMDADDIALPKRLERQVALLDNELSVGLCGTAYQMFGTLDRVIHLPTTDKQIREFMLEHSPMGHPTVMFRKAVLDKHNLIYNKSFMPAEDYKMWYDFSQVSELRNLPEVLLHYRVHPHQISSYQNATQQIHADSVRVMQLLDKGFSLTDKEQKLYCRILNHHASLQDANEFESVLELMQNILRQNAKLKAYDASVFLKIFSASWHRFICAIKKFTPAHIIPVLIKAKPVVHSLGFFAKTKFALKSIVSWEVS